MPEQSQEVLGLVARVRARWRRLIVLQGTTRAALAASAVLSAALAVASLGGRSPLLLALVGVAALALVGGVVIWGFWPARQSPSNARVARFIEESESSLDDRLVSAVDLLDSGAIDAGVAPALAGPMLDDAGRRAAAVEPESVVPGHLLRRVGLTTALALLLVVAVGYAGRETAGQSARALGFILFPSRTALEIAPGNVRIQAGAPLRIDARLVGSAVAVDAHLLRADASGERGGWTSTEMVDAGSGAYYLECDGVDEAFSYRVVAGGLTSDTYHVSVASPPRVTRVDVEYVYPTELGLDPQVDEDSGDVYAPAGTAVRLRIYADGDGVTGRLMLEEGTVIELEPEGTVLVAAFTVERDSSYHVALVDAGGLTNARGTEYFIRALSNRPPRVRILRPARDREVTRLEEVEVEAEAIDDFGVAQFELVYSIAGEEEQVLPFDVGRGSTVVTGSRVLYLEDLPIEIGEFVSYYVRARDRASGGRAAETRSDIFFLQVKPFERRFTAAQGQGMGGASTDTSISELVEAQKDVIVATWQLDRRAEAAGGIKVEEDIQAVARAEAELMTRVEQTSSSRRTSTLRDPNRARRFVWPTEPGVPADGAAAADTVEPALTAAAIAMGQAVTALEEMQTREAVSPEMLALTNLLKAQGQVAERQVSDSQAASGGSGANRSTEDLSGLFDRELQRLQQTTYETPGSAEPSQAPGRSQLDRIKELARRQDELLREQETLDQERERMSEEAVERRIERLTREQEDLRQQAQALAREMLSEASPSWPSQPDDSPSGGQQQAGSQLRSASEEMRGSATEMTRRDSGQAVERSARALEQLRRLERQLERASADGQRRALGDMQLEARQIGDAEREVSKALGRLGDREVARDAMRRLAGEQERLAERVRRLEEALEEQSSGPEVSGGEEEVSRLRQAAGDAAKELAEYGLDDRMLASADAMRRVSETSPDGAPVGERSPSSSDSAGDGAARSASSQALRQDADDAGRRLDRIADALAAARAVDGDSRRLAGQLAKVRELQEALESLTKQLQRFDEGPPAPNAQTELARLQEEYGGALRETGALVNQLSRNDSSLKFDSSELSLGDQGMVLSAPGTEAFKQDFGTWEELRRQATQALALAESSLSRRLNAEASRDRLSSGIEDSAPAEYQRQVDDYFKALAGRGRR